MDVLQDHIDVRATEQPELPIRLCQRAPWVCCKTNQLQRIARRHITVCMVIDKKGHQRQHQHLHDQHQHHQDQHQQQHQANVLCLPCAFAQANVNTTPHPRPVASPERHTNSIYIYIFNVWGPRAGIMYIFIHSQGFSPEMGFKMGSKNGIRKWGPKWGPKMGSSNGVQKWGPT